MRSWVDINLPTTTKLRLRFTELFSHSLITSKPLLFGAGASEIVRCDRSSAASPPLESSVLASLVAFLDFADVFLPAEEGLELAVISSLQNSNLVTEL